MAKNYKELLKHVTTFCFDVDGVFTDGIVYLIGGGEQARTANVRDGYAVQLAIKKGYRIAIISGGRSQEVQRRFEGLGVEDVFLGSSDKVAVLNEEICYMGDDIPDLKVMHMVGIPCCPSDAVPEIQDICQYVSHKSGGKGCVRDILEQTMRLQGNWMDNDAHHW
jgi:3-deoxy-D-manno-octulosonate 8-phosphate phosphatase (KDO 8-P phosphatase)